MSLKHMCIEIGHTNSAMVLLVFKKDNPVIV